MMKIIAMTNKKGGVGKTTTALATAACLGQSGFSVLAVDMDPQMNFSLACPGRKRSLINSGASIFWKRRLVP